MSTRRAFVALLTLLLFRSLASACDFGFRPISELYEMADAVFVGKVTESPWKQLPGGVASSGSVRVVRFTIERPIKGIQGKEISFPLGGGCQYPFLEGEIYLVHAYRSNGRLETGQQMRPLLIADATKELKYIDSVLSNRAEGILYVSIFQPPPNSKLMLRLEGGGRRLQTTVTPTPGGTEISTPPGEYTVWLERDGKAVSETKKVKITAKKAVLENLTVRP
jgi:hypothetical protein